MVRIDDRGHGQNLVDGIINDGVNRRIANYREVFREVFIRLNKKEVISGNSRGQQTHLIEGHELLCGIGLFFVQRYEFDISGWPSLVSEGGLQCV